MEILFPQRLTRYALRNFALRRDWSCRLSRRWWLRGPVSGRGNCPSIPPFGRRSRILCSLSLFALHGEVNAVQPSSIPTLNPMRRRRRGFALMPPVLSATRQASVAPAWSSQPTAPRDCLWHARRAVLFRGIGSQAMPPARRRAAAIPALESPTPSSGSTCGHVARRSPRAPAQRADAASLRDAAARAHLRA